MAFLVEQKSTKSCEILRSVRESRIAAARFSPLVLFSKHISTAILVHVLAHVHVPVSSPRIEHLTISEVRVFGDP